MSVQKEWDKKREAFFASDPKCKECGGQLDHYSRTMLCRGCQKIEYKKRMDKKHKPFATYNQFAEWISRNCDSCKKGFDKKRRRFRCDWEWKLCRAAIGNGEIIEKVAKAIGYLDSEGCDLWQCPGWARR